MKELPKGIRINHGYVEARITHKGQMYYKTFGAESPLRIQVAEIWLNDRRKEILLETFNLKRAAPEKLFSDVAELFCDRRETQRGPDGTITYTPEAIYELRRSFRVNIVPHFAKFHFHDIKPKDVILWRQYRLQSVGGTTVNREQNNLSALFTTVEQWVKNEEIKEFRIPASNPCSTVEKAELKKRDRVVTAYEIAKLKNAAISLGDANGKDNISLAIKTCLSDNDLKTLKFGDTVDLLRSKSGVEVKVPVLVMHQPNWTNWRKRWQLIRTASGIQDIEWRDLRKAAINLLQDRGHPIKAVSQYAGHASQKTTESFYSKVQIDQMATLAKDLTDFVDGL